jgi:hypothetical protein
MSPRKLFHAAVFFVFRRELLSCFFTAASGVRSPVSVGPSASMMCQPYRVCTGSEISWVFSLNATSSNSGTE